MKMSRGNLLCAVLLLQLIFSGLKMSLGNFFGLDKLQKLMRMVKQHGGLKASLYHLYLTDDLKVSY
jgi:hypothetical protein